VIQAVHLILRQASETVADRIEERIAHWVPFVLSETSSVNGASGTELSSKLPIRMQISSLEQQ
jgi:hypothetical protein